MTETTEAEPLDLSLPVPKFKIGDTIYWPTTKTEHVVYDCPDCGGSAVWHVKTAKTEFDVPCQRCRSYGKQPPRTLTAMRYMPVVKSMVIAAIKAERNSEPSQWSRAQTVTYHEKHNTGWSVEEHKALASEVEALAIAEEMAAAENVKLDKRADEIRTREIAALDLTDALAAIESDTRRAAERKYEKAITEITEMPDHWYNFDSKYIEFEMRKIARHILGELGEDIPEDWGED